MPQPSTGPAEADVYLAVCGHTHLFPGARCRVQGVSDPRAFAADPWPIELRPRFSGEVCTEAELHTCDLERPVLAVLSYVTAAGTRIDDRGWLVRESQRMGDEVELVLGGHAPT